MNETEAIIKIASEMENVCTLLASISVALWLILLCKRCYSYTDGIKDAIRKLTDFIASRR